MSVYKKLLEIQKSVRGFGKDKRGHNYDYVSGTKILSHIRSKMDELGLLLKQEVLDIENQRQDYKTKFGEKSEILSKVDMRFTWIDVDTLEKDVNLFGANGMNDFDKGVGSALTYAERYFLLKYFHIPTDEDDVDNPDRKPPTDEDDKAKQKDPVKPVDPPEDKMQEKAFNQALARINKGEKGIVQNIKDMSLPISNVQLATLESAEKNYKPQP